MLREACANRSSGRTTARLSTRMSSSISAAAVRNRPRYSHGRCRMRVAVLL